MRRLSVRWFFLIVATGLVTAYLLLPTLVVIPMSFNRSSTLGVFAGGWTTEWYRELFTSPEWRSAGWNSLQVAVGTTVAATVLGTLAAWGLSRNGRFTSLVQGTMFAPLIVPPVVLGVGLYTLLLGANLTGTIPGLIFAHTVLALPFVVVAVSASFAQVDPNYEKAAAVLGAPPWQRLRRVVLPLVAPGIVSGALFAFITSWDEIVISIFLTDLETKTLPVLMWSQVRTQVTPTLAALGTCLVVLSTLALAAMHPLGKGMK